MTRALTAANPRFLWPPAPTGPNPDLSALLACSTARDPCAACGIGSLFIAAVMKADQLPMHDFLVNRGRPREVEYLQRWFSAQQLDLIEDYFEHPDSSKWADRSPKKRLVMIMENIISNGGEFNPYRGKHGSR